MRSPLVVLLLLALPLALVAGWAVRVEPAGGPPGARVDPSPAGEVPRPDPGDRVPVPPPGRPAGHALAPDPVPAGGPAATPADPAPDGPGTGEALVHGRAGIARPTSAATPDWREPGARLAGAPRADGRTAIVGRVVDRALRPVHGAQVFLADPADPDAADPPPDAGGGGPHPAAGPRAAAQTDREGRFRVLGDPGSGTLLWAERPGTGRSLPLALPFPGHGRLDVRDVVLRGTGRLEGALALAGGRPLVGVGLEARRVDGAREPGLTSGHTTTDGAGRFDLGGLAPGEYELRVLDEPGLLGLPAARAWTGGRALRWALPAARVEVRCAPPSADPPGGAAPPPPSLVELRVELLDADGPALRRYAEEPCAGFVLLLPSGREVRLRALDAEGRTWGADLRTPADRDEVLVELEPLGGR